MTGRVPPSFQACISTTQLHRKGLHYTNSDWQFQSIQTEAFQSRSMSESAGKIIHSSNRNPYRMFQEQETECDGCSGVWEALDLTPATSFRNFKQVPCWPGISNIRRTLSPCLKGSSGVIGGEANSNSFIPMIPWRAEIYDTTCIQMPVQVTALQRGSNQAKVALPRRGTNRCGRGVQALLKSTHK